MKTPIFEQTTSGLYYSNDGLLHLSTEPGNGPYVEYVVSYGEYEAANEVFRTFDRIKADAYIAGYDLARDKEKS